MRFAGIDIASETHVVAVVDVEGATVQRPTRFDEDERGYQTLLELLGDPSGCTVAMEATGHYWQNLFAVLVANGYEIALLNPLRTRRFAQEDLERTKTDAIDALGIARFAQQKRPTPTTLPDSVTSALRELVRLRDRLVQEMGDKVRHLHRAVDLGFPEFTRYVKTLSSQLATTILHEYPTAKAFPGVPRSLSKLVYDGKHKVGPELAGQLVEAAKRSVGQHHDEPYQIQVRFCCEDIDLLRNRLRDIEERIETVLRDHEVGTLLTTIDGIGPQTAARIIAEICDFGRFANARKLAAYVGVIPGLKHSGKSRGRGAMTSIGHAALRRALWMPVLSAVRVSPWLGGYYRHLKTRGKPPKVALIAVMRKLLCAIYSVATNRRAFVPQQCIAEVQL
jgi:transposase